MEIKTIAHKISSNWILLCFLFIGSVTQVKSQLVMGPPQGMKLTYEQEALGKASMECIYLYKRTNAKKQSESMRLILQANNNLSKCYSLAKYRIDSVANLNGRNRMKPADFQKILNSYSERSIGDNLCFNSREYRDLKKSTITSVVYEFGPTSLEYATTLPAVRWKTDYKDRRTICGYTCRKATGTLGGRNWTVWYSTDIPISSGPWKLGDLPGLILQAADSTGEHSFEAVSIRNSKETIFLDKFRTQKTTALKVLEMSREKYTSPSKYDVGFGVIVPQYSLLEK